MSYLNDCHYCQSIHGAIAAAHLDGDEELVRRVKADFQYADISEKMKALLIIASKVQRGGKHVTTEDMTHARSLGASDVEIHDAVLIAAAFCMYNRYVDGLATVQPRDEAMYRERQDGGARRLRKCEQNLSSGRAGETLRRELIAHIALPEDLPGISGAFAFRSETAKPMRELAHILLHEINSLTPGERELIATFVSSQNDCYFCQTSHGAAAASHLGGDEVVRRVKTDYESAPVSPKLKALLAIAGKVQRDGKLVTAEDVERAKREGASDVEIHDTVLIAAASACTTVTWTALIPGNRAKMACIRKWGSTWPNMVI